MYEILDEYIRLSFYTIAIVCSAASIFRPTRHVRQIGVLLLGNVVLGCGMLFSEINTILPIVERTYYDMFITTPVVVAWGIFSYYALIKKYE
jgi:hypothetical protein